MNRLVQATMFALALAASGCARGRSALPPDPLRGSDLGPIEIKPVEPIRASINAGKVPADLSTVRASYVVETPEPAPPPEPVEADPQADDPPRPAQPAKPADRPKATATPVAPPASDPAMTIRADANLAPGKAATKTVAVVGDTIITGRMLYTATCQRMGIKPGEMNQVPKPTLNENTKQTLDSLIEYTMILQEGRREVKKIQQWNQFTDFIDKDWREKELPSLLHKEKAEDELILRQKLEAQGESLDDLKDDWKLKHMATQLLMLRVQPKVVKPSLPDLEKYYAEHRNDPSFHRDAKVHWREIFVPVEDAKELAAARKSAVAIRARLVAGEDFAKLAKSTSAGATAAQGGAWVTAHDGHAHPTVNDALGKLAPGQISPLIESPNGIYILRVEKRTTAGPVPFVEVQRKIAETLFDARFHAAIELYIKNLRKRTNVSSPMFDVGNGPPVLVQQKTKTDPQTKPASTK